MPSLAALSPEIQLLPPCASSVNTGQCICISFFTSIISVVIIVVAIIALLLLLHLLLLLLFFCAWPSRRLLVKSCSLKLWTPRYGVVFDSVPSLQILFKTPKADPVYTLARAFQQLHS